MKYIKITNAFCLPVFGLLQAGCAEPVTQAPEPVPADVPVEIHSAATIGDWGVDLTNIDELVEPGDDFFRYASGTWLKNYELPPDKTSFGSFYLLRDRSQERVRELISELATSEPDKGTVEQKIGDYYSSFMNSDLIDTRGYEPIQSDLQAISAISNLEELAVAFGHSEVQASSTPIGYSIEIDRLDPDRFIAGIAHSGLGLPDRDYYLEDSERFAKIRAAYLAHVQTMLELVEFEGADTLADEVLALETRIAEQQWPRADRRNRDLTYNVSTLAEIEAEYPDFPWRAFLTAGGAVPASLNVRHPSAMGPLVEIINETDLSVWRAYLTYHLVSNNAAFLAAEIDEKNFDFYGRTLRGQLEQRERWRRGISLVSSSQSLGDAIGQVYAERFFPPESKAQMLELVENLRTALRLRIEQLDWMGDETKEQAYQKLEAFLPLIGYPDEWRDYSAVQIDPENLFGNVKGFREYFHDDDFSRLNEPTDRREWFYPAQTVNAFYTPQFNAITFPAGILEPPFFDAHADAAVNYGAIGAVIGHEMGHGFDDQGSKSDARGVQRNWWTDEDRARFDARTAKLAEQYSRYEPVEGTFIDGNFTLGENIGDLGGVNVAYLAYHLSLDGEEPPLIDGLTGDQRFFMAFAQVWRSKIRDESLVTRLKTDPHSPPEFRVNGIVRNVDAWYDAFSVTEKDDLYLAPEERVAIW